MASSVLATKNYGDIQLDDHARAHIGDNNISHIYQYMHNESSEEAKRKAFLKSLSFESMNEKRNQLRKTEHVEWIWGSSLPDVASLEVSSNSTDVQKRRELRRIELSGLWGFDGQNHDIWRVIEQELDSLEPGMLDHMVSCLDPGFSTWLTTTEPIFWISGKPASGKSTLMKYLFENSKSTNLLKQRSQADWQLLHFFFDFRAENSTANSMAGMFRIFLFQLIREMPGAFNYFSNHPTTKDLDVSHNDLSPEQLQAVFKSYLTDTGVHVCIFVDGLDEFTGSVPKLIRVLRSLTDGVRVKMCLASRPEAAIQNTLKDVPGLRLQNYNHISIATFAADMFRDATDSEDDSTSFWKLVASIIAQASGVILWADLVCADVCDGLLAQETPEELILRIRTYPTELDGVYARLLNKLDQRFGVETSIVLYLLLDYSHDNHTETKHSPDLDTLQHMLEILRDCNWLPSFPAAKIESSAFKIRLLSRLGGLVDVVPNYEWLGGPSAIRIIHRTLASYLISTSSHLKALPQDFVTEYPDHVWLRIYCMYISQSSLLDRCPLVYMFDLGVLRRNRHGFSSFIYEDVRKLRAMDIEIDCPEGWTMENEHELSRLLYACSQSLCRAAVAQHDSGVFHLIQETLVASARRVHGLCLFPEDENEEKFMVNCSNKDNALMMSLAYSLWDHAIVFDGAVAYGNQLQTLSARIIATIPCRDRGFKVRELPKSLATLDFWIRRIVQGIDVIDVVTAQFQPKSYQLQTPKHTVFCRMIALRPRQPWNTISASRCQGVFRTLCFFVPFLKARRYPGYYVGITSLDWLWNFKFTTPMPSWMNDSGVTCLFTLAMLCVNADGVTEDVVTTLFEWIDLLVASGANLNDFCYPNGTLLHLFIECFRFDRPILLLIQGLVTRGIDVSLRGPKGTALDIAHNFPGSRSSLFALKFYEDTSEGWTVAPPSDSDCTAAQNGSSELEPGGPKREDEDSISEQDVIADVIKLLENATGKDDNVTCEAWVLPPLESWLRYLPDHYNAEGNFDPDSYDTVVIGSEED